MAPGENGKPRDLDAGCHDANPVDLMIVCSPLYTVGRCGRSIPVVRMFDAYESSVEILRCLFHQVSKRPSSLLLLYLYLRKYFNCANSILLHQ